MPRAVARYPRDAESVDSWARAEAGICADGQSGRSRLASRSNSNSLRSGGCDGVTYGARRISTTSGGNTYYYHYDPLGSDVNLTSATGASEWTDSNEPYT